MISHQPLAVAMSASAVDISMWAASATDDMHEGARGRKFTESHNRQPQRGQLIWATDLTSSKCSKQQSPALAGMLSGQAYSHNVTASRASQALREAAGAGCCVQVLDLGYQAAAEGPVCTVHTALHGRHGSAQSGEHDTFGIVP